MAPMIGALVWTVATAAFGLTIIESLALWAPLVVVPLGLDLIAEVPRLLRRIQLPAAALAAASFAGEPGLLAGAMAVPWALFCIALAFVGAARFFRRRDRFSTELLIDAALGLIAVGGWGLVMSRAGLKPAGFQEPIVLLTAVHFHYTAFAAPLIAALAARKAGPRRSIFAAGTAVVIATPALAIGFTLHVAILKLIAIATIALGLVALAWELVRLATSLPETRPRVLAGLAAFSIFWGMALAILYGIGEYSGRPIIGIPAMAWSHGILNGFGFATGGLLALRR
jgi:hypothetical protein